MRLWSWNEVAAAPSEPHAGPGAILCLSLTVLLFAGCGDGDSSAPTVVPPPAPAAASDAADTVSGSDSNAQDSVHGPPGAIELPPGNIPPPDAGQAPESQGIEMPAGVDVPDTSGVDRASGAAAAPQIRYATWEEIQLAANEPSGPVMETARTRRSPRRAA